MTEQAEDIQQAAMHDLHGHYIEDLKVGMTDSYGKTVTEGDIVMFAGVSGDTNPVHLNEDFARQTIFGSRIAHGMLAAGFVSTVLGTRLPGPGAIYAGQSLNFKAPVKVGDTVRARATVTEVNTEKRKVKVETVCTVDDKVVMDGEAKLFVDSRADAKDPAVRAAGVVPPPANTPPEALRHVIEDADRPGEALETEGGVGLYAALQNADAVLEKIGGRADDPFDRLYALLYEHLGHLPGDKQQAVMAELESAARVVKSATSQQVA